MKTCPRCGRTYTKETTGGKYCQSCQPITRQLNYISYEVAHSPTVDGEEVWPCGSHLSRLEIDHCLRLGYFPPGLELRKTSGEVYRVVGREMRQQKLEQVE